MGPIQSHCKNSVVTLNRLVSTFGYQVLNCDNSMHRIQLVPFQDENRFTGNLRSSADLPTVEKRSIWGVGKLMSVVPLSEGINFDGLRRVKLRPQHDFYLNLWLDRGLRRLGRTTRLPSFRGADWLKYQC